MLTPGSVWGQLASGMGCGVFFHSGGFLESLLGIRLVMVLVQAVPREIPIFPRGVKPLLHGGFGEDTGA